MNRLASMTLVKLIASNRLDRANGRYGSIAFNKRNPTIPLSNWTPSLEFLSEGRNSIGSVPPFRFLHDLDPNM